MYKPLYRAALLVSLALPAFSDDHTDKPLSPDAEPVKGVATGNVTVTDPIVARDLIIERYAACFGVDPAVMRAVGKEESGLKVWAQTGYNKKTQVYKYQGLFQMDSTYCAGTLDKAKFPFLSCDNMIDPEANTAAAAKAFSDFGARVAKVCPKPSTELAVTLSYVGHNNGEGVLGRILKKGGAEVCKIVDPTEGSQPAGQEKLIREAYTDCSWIGDKHCNTGKLIKNYREKAKENCRTHGGGDECYVRVKPVCQGKKQFDLYTRDKVLEWELKAECVPEKETEGEIAQVSRIGSVDEGWAVEKWWVGVSAGRAAAKASKGVPDPKLCPTKRLFDLDTDKNGAISNDEIAAVFPK